jgi:dienelactone hydrolase
MVNNIYNIQIMVKKSNFIIQNKSGAKIYTDIYSKIEQEGERPLVIFSHGFKGFKDWGGFPYMLEKIADAGFFCVSFNFTFNGIGETNQTEFTRLDLFAQNTFTKELDDLETVIEYFYSNSGKYNIDKEKIGIIGHSRGGGISIIKSCENKKIKCLITLASVSCLDRYSEEHKKKWREKGYFEVLNTRTNQVMRLNSALLDDIENNKERLDILNAVNNLKIPFLIVHGKEDLSVKFKEAKALYNSSNKNLTELFTAENTGHTFGVVHPFQGTTKAFETVIGKIKDFLKKNL